MQKIFADLTIEWKKSKTIIIKSDLHFETLWQYNLPIGNRKGNEGCSIKGVLIELVNYIIKVDAACNIQMKEAHVLQTELLCKDVLSLHNDTRYNWRKQ